MYLLDRGQSLIVRLKLTPRISPTTSSTRFVSKSRGCPEAEGYQEGLSTSPASRQDGIGSLSTVAFAAECSGGYMLFISAAEERCERPITLLGRSSHAPTLQFLTQPHPLRLALG